jgi:Family of unknown function (DUF7003)
MNTAQILEDLDKHASEFNFPVLDNAYIEFAAARLSAFQSVKDWLIVFEVLGFSTREVEFVDGLYVYGSCIERAGFTGTEIPLSSSPKQPLFDAETNQCIADWSHWLIGVGNEEMPFSPTREEYADAGIVIDREPGRGSLSEIELLRFLVHRLGKERFFLSDEDLLRRFPICKNLRKFVQTTQWEHPDIANEEKPSKNISIRSLVEALSKRNPSLFDQGLSNTHWTYWLQAT